MKKLIVLFAAASMFTACSNSGNSTEDKKDSSGAMNNNSSMESKRARNEQTALASVQGINAHDVNAILKDAATEVTDYSDGSMAPVKNMDTIRAGITAWLNAFPDIKGENLMAMSDADGRHVIVVGDWTGTFKNDFMGMKATNKSFKYSDGDILTFNDEGKITEHRSLQSNMTAMAQIGAKMK